MTTPPDAARAIATTLVEARLAACVSIVGLVESIYRWEGKIERDDESLLVIKTTRAAVDGLTEAIRKVHPYENFELVALPIVAGSPAYLSWIDDALA